MKTSTAIKRLSTATALAAISASSLAISRAEAGIIQLNPFADPLQGPGYITFDEVTYTPPNGPTIGNNYDDIFFARDWIYPSPGNLPVLNPDPSVGVTFAERFVGQSLSYNGNFDVVPSTPEPTNPLALQIGLANENVNVWQVRRVLSGLGPLGWPNNNAIGEGAIAILFDREQTEFGFELGDWNIGGSLTLSFFQNDGSLIGSPITLDPNNPYWIGNGQDAFKTDGGDEIWGVSITNDDPDGIWIDNIIYNNPGPPIPPPQNVPEASSVLGLLALGALGGGLKLKSKLKP